MRTYLLVRYKVSTLCNTTTNHIATPSKYNHDTLGECSIDLLPFSLAFPDVKYEPHYAAIASPRTMMLDITLLFETGVFGYRIQLITSLYSLFIIPILSAEDTIIGTVLAGYLSLDPYT